MKRSIKLILLETCKNMRKGDDVKMISSLKTIGLIIYLVEDFEYLSTAFVKILTFS